MCVVEIYCTPGYELLTFEGQGVKYRDVPEVKITSGTSLNSPAFAYPHNILPLISNYYSVPSLKALFKSTHSGLNPGGAQNCVSSELVPGFHTIYFHFSGRSFTCAGQQVLMHSSRKKRIDYFDYGKKCEIYCLR